jgi:protocatechuate 3,4-dioxygenase beta subunit
VATTDAEGRFRITGLPAGRALVVADAEELCESASPPIELVALQEVGNVVLHLERGHSLEGVVTDAGGRPVEGARVNAVTGDGFGRVAALMRGDSDATTGGDGRFAIRGLTPGVYEVSVEADGFAPKSLAGIDPATSPPLEFMLSSSARVSGTVRLKGSGAPASGVKVQLVPWWGEDNALPAFDLPDVENKAAEEGAFVIEDVEPGQYRVAARGEGTTRAFSAPITIAEGANVDGVFVEVERGAVLSGRVVDAATGAPVPDAEVVCFQPSEPANAPLAAPPGRRVRMTSRIGALPRLAFDPFRRNAGRAKCDAEGRFRIEHLSAGGYVLDASHADYATARTEEIEVAAAEVKDGAEVRLGRGGTVEGLVTGIDGKPRAGDRVDVESRSVEGVTRSALCDANGWYRIEHVPAGEAIATRSENEATPRGPHLVLRTIVSGGESEQERGKRIVVEEGETLRVDFSQMEKPYVEGFVTCADGAVAGALVSASPAAGPGALPLVFGAEKEATTGADGSFRLSDLDPGDWRVSVRHPQGLVPTTATVVLEPGSPARQDFFLEGGVVEGDVVASKGGAKLEGATVALERVQSGESPAGVLRSDFAVSFVMARRGGASQQIRFGGGRGGARVSTDRGGHFRVPWVPAGKYRVSVSKPGFLDSRSDEIEVAPNGHVGGMKIELAPAAKLVVKLRSKSTGQPLSGCPVQLRSEDDESETGFTTAEGVAIFESLKPGAWTATGKLSWNDADGQSTTVTCESERTTEITLDL